MLSYHVVLIGGILRYSMLLIPLTNSLVDVHYDRHVKMGILASVQATIGNTMTKERLDSLVVGWI